MKENVLLRATTVLNKSNYDDNEIVTVYKDLKTINNKTLRMFYKTQTIPTFENDLVLYMEVLKKLYDIIENNEKYHDVINE